MTAIVLGCLIGLILGNFSYEAATKRRWSTAVDRSWFQCVAVAFVVGAILVAPVDTPAQPQTVEKLPSHVQVVWTEQWKWQKFHKVKIADECFVIIETGGNPGNSIAPARCEP